MFNCQSPNHKGSPTSAPGEKPVRVVLEGRRRTYRNRMNQVLGEGWEIVKEATFCSPCAIITREQL